MSVRTQLLDSMVAENQKEKRKADLDKACHWRPHLQGPNFLQTGFTTLQQPIKLWICGWIYHWWDQKPYDPVTSHRPTCEHCCIGGKAFNIWILGRNWKSDNSFHVNLEYNTICYIYIYFEYKDQETSFQFILDLLLILQMIQ